MANNYSYFSFSFETRTAEELAWLLTHMAITPDTLSDTALKEFAETVGCDAQEIVDYWPPCEVETQGNTVYMYSEESFDSEMVAGFLSAFLRAHNRTDILSFEYAVTCSKPRPGEFGGGAVVISATEWDEKTTTSLERELREKMSS